MRKLFSLIAALTLYLSVFTPTYSSYNFKEEQLQYPKVRLAYAEKEDGLKNLFLAKGIPYPPKRVFLRVFKVEKKIEVWVAQNDQFAFLKDYPFCLASGVLGPKREAGDKQTPEGFYTLDRFNPQSNYFLSLGINYPNRSDQLLSSARSLGGDIFIHGNCGTRGCIPITDEKIKELYILAVEARNQGQPQIPVHIFPTRLNEKGMKYLKKNFKDPELMKFWANLQPGYQLFEEQKRLFTVFVDDQGYYSMVPPENAASFTMTKRP